MNTKIQRSKGSSLIFQQLVGKRSAPNATRETVILFSSEPGAFTAVVRGAGNTTGVALCEAYLLDCADAFAG